ncbi:MAG: lectin, partial [Vicinamibacterales bacterium]
MPLLTLLLACGRGVQLETGSQATAKTTFFITSAGPGNGANLGGLAGADRHCQSLADAAG